MVLRIDCSQKCVLEYGVSIETELVLDHAVGDFPRHLIFGHLRGGEVLGGEAGAIDAGGVRVVVIAEVESGIAAETASGRVDLLRGRNSSEVNHDVESGGGKENGFVCGSFCLCKWLAECGGDCVCTSTIGIDHVPARGWSLTSK